MIHRPALGLLFLGTCLAGPLHALRWQPAALDFGTRSVGQPATATVWLVNDGSEAMDLPTLSTHLEGLDWQIQGGSLAAGDSLELALDWTPSQNMPYLGALAAEGDTGGWGLSLSGSGDLAGSTWDGSYGLSGNALRDHLRTVVRQHSELGYTTARTIMFGSLDNVGGWVESVYTGFQLQTSGIPDHTVMNTEHTWPQSLFNGADSIRTDLHHLFPCKSNINSSRGNLPFGNVVNSSSGFPTGGADRGTDANGTTVFEPRLSHKGDCARSMFYVALHYGNLSGFLGYQEATLRDWSELDPVSQKERDRNDGIEGAQGNRNPFVDHPGFLDRLATLSGSNANLPAVQELAAFPAGGLDLGSGTEAELAGGLLLCNTGSQVLHFGAPLLSPAVFVLEGFPASLAPGESAQCVIRPAAGEEGGLLASLQYTSEAGSASHVIQALVESAQPQPLELQIRIENFQVVLEWNEVPGAGGYRIQSRLPGEGWGDTSFTTNLAAQLIWDEYEEIRFYRVLSE